MISYEHTKRDIDELDKHRTWPDQTMNCGGAAVDVVTTNLNSDY